MILCKDNALNVDVKELYSRKKNLMTTPTRAGNSPIAVEIEEGKKYAWCACGLSSKQPYCDGSHKGSGMAPIVFTADESKTAYLCACKQTGNGPFCDGSHSK